MSALSYYHVDVFSSEPFAGNGLIVFTGAGEFSDDLMQTLTQEMRQFESIFLQSIEGNVVRARIFTCHEELDFAGHPVLGAAATLHDLLKKDDEKADWIFQLNEKAVSVSTEQRTYGYDCSMNQGKALFGKVLNAEETASILHFIECGPNDLYPDLPPTVVSTGLSYLIVPLQENGYRARIGASGMDEKLQDLGAQFLGLLDIAPNDADGTTYTIRTGENDGSVEDIATGSLVGPVGAYLVARGLEKPDELIAVQQGQNLGRNSQLQVKLATCPDGTMDVIVQGSVCKIASGVLNAGFAL